MSGIQALVLSALAITSCVALSSTAALQQERSRLEHHKAERKNPYVAHLQTKVSEAERQHPKQMAMPDECTKMMQDLQTTPGAQEASQKCEAEGKYGDKAIAALQTGDEKAAIAHVSEVFLKCGKLSEKCAALVAPALVMEMRASGVAVTDACKAEYTKVQKDEKSFNATAACDKKEKLSEKTLSALSANDGDAAMEHTQMGLEKCMKISKTCAFQLAPVVLNSIVMRAMEEQLMATVLVAQPVLVVEDEGPVIVVEDDEEPVKEVATGNKDTSKTVEAKGPTMAPPKAQPEKKSVSLLGMAGAHTPVAKTYKKRNSMVREAHVTPALVQTAAHHAPRVSKLLIDLLVSRKHL